MGLGFFQENMFYGLDIARYTRDQGPGSEVPVASATARKGAVNIKDGSPAHGLHGGELADRDTAWHPGQGMATSPQGGVEVGLFALLPWQLCVSHSPVAALAALANHLQLCLSQYWHLKSLFLNPVLKRGNGCGGCFT